MNQRTTKTLFVILATIAIIILSVNAYNTHAPVANMGVGNSAGVAMITDTQVQKSSSFWSTLTAAVGLSSLKRTITWQTNNYPATAGVDINLIKKTSGSPTSYVLVRKLAINTSNSGSYSWTPQAGETGNNLYVQVVCSSTYSFKNGCSIGIQPVPVN